jgi:hypothetical protein
MGATQRACSQGANGSEQSRAFCGGRGTRSERRQTSTVAITQYERGIDRPALTSARAVFYVRKRKERIVPRKPISEKISSIQAEIQQLKNEEKRLLQAQNEQERKARTKRLIERGAILESLIGNAAGLTNEQIKTLLERTVGSSYGVKVVDGIRAQGVGVPAAKPALAVQGGGAAPSAQADETEGREA